MEVGPGLGFEDTFAMVVRGDDARRLGVRTISDVVRKAESHISESRCGAPGFWRRDCAAWGWV